MAPTNKTGLILCFLTAFAMGCQGGEKFPDLGTNVIGPIDVAVGATGEYFYVLNTDYDRTYGLGSILVINEAGEKVSSVAVPRLGRALAVAGNDLIAVFDRQDDSSSHEVQLYDLSVDPKKPQFVKSWTSADGETNLNFAPINVVMREGYPHFAVTTMSGQLLMGTLATPRSDSTLKLVRQYENHGIARRAVYIDPKRELLLAFVTDYGDQKLTDFSTADEKSYAEDTGKVTDEPNEIPDEYEDTKYRRRNSWPSRYQYQFILYDIASERTQGFPLRAWDNRRDVTAQKEQRWLYYTLSDFDGTPDTDAGITNPGTKHYRANFWSTQPDPYDANSFYISHRGKNSAASKYSNNIVKVSFMGNPRQLTPLPKTSRLFSFERVYGFKGELDETNHYPGDFKVQIVNGRLMLLVNHFKDLSNFRKGASYGLAAKLLDGSFWRSEIMSTSVEESFYQVAINQRGKGLTCAFYSSSVIPLELTPGTAIKLGWNSINRIK